MPPWTQRGLDRLIQWQWLAVPLLLAVAAALRLSDLDWDNGHLFHPDERHILMVTEGIKLSFPLDRGLLLSPESPLNPRSFAYGSLIFYLLRFVHWLVNALAGLVGLDSPSWLGADIRNLRFVGRALSALFDTGTVYLTYLLGRTLYGRRVGLLAAAFVAFSVLHIQLSHFYASDTPMTFFVTAALLLSAYFVKWGHERHAIGAAVAAGLALACKFSAAPILAAVAASHALRAILPADGASGGGGLARLRLDGGRLNRAVGAFLLVLPIVVAVFVVFEPYAVIDSKLFFTNLAEQNAMVRGAADLPYTRQYIDRTPFWYFIDNLALFGVGLPLGLTMLGGWLYVAVRALRDPRRADLMLLAFVLPYFAITGTFHAKFLRYLLPITPALCLFAAIGLWKLYDWARRPARAPGPGEIGRRTEWAELETLPALDGGNGPGGDGPGTAGPDGAREGDAAPRRWAEAPGTGYLAEAPVAAASPAVEIDEEARRWLEMKGLAAFEVAADDPPPVVGGSPAEDRDGPQRADWGSSSAPERSPHLGPPPEEEGTDAEPGAWTWRRGLAAATIALVLGLTFLYALAYQQVYAGEHPAVEASRWIYNNVPRGSTLAKEHWEEGFPVAVQDVDDPRRQLDPGVFGYREVELALYENDDERKLQHISSTLARTDYVLFFSNRLYGTIPRLPERYPLTKRYYQMLFGEQLGFQLVAEFTRYPEVGGVALIDDTLTDPGLPEPPLHASHVTAPVKLNLGRADESFSVYDHPKVLIFRKTRPITEAQYRAILAPALAGGVRQGPAGVPAPVFRSLLETPELRALHQAGGTFRDLFDRNGLANQLPFLFWVVALLVVGVAATPLTLVTLSRFGDGGLPLARTLGILLMTWVSWIAVSVLKLEANRAAAYLGLAVLLLLGGLLARRALPTLRELWLTRRSALVAGELAFWVPFLYFVWIRMLNPDLWHAAHGGEKPMDVAYLMATVKSAAYPPYDPWFAGGILNYYYFGQLIVAQLIKITGIIPTTAYNLAVPTLFALTFCGAYCVAYNVARRGGLVSERAAIAGGAIAGLLVCVLGNLGGAIQIGEGLVRLSGTAYQSLLPGSNYVVLALIGLFNWVVLRRPYDIPVDWYWPSTRVIPGTINELPYFTFLYADLHAHMIALPFTLLAIAAAANLFLSSPPRLRLSNPAVEARLRFALPVALPRARLQLPELRSLPRLGTWTLPVDLIQLLVTGLTVGALLPINSWDFPTYLGLVSVAALAPWYLQERRDLASLGASLGRLVLVALLSYGLYLPFHRSFVSFYSSVRPTPEQSPPILYLVIHGLFLFVLVSYMARDAAAALRPTGAGRTLGAMARRWDRLPHLLALRTRLVKHDDGSGTLVTYGLGGLGLLVLLAAALGYALAGLLLALLLVVLWRLLARPRSPESALILLLFATGLALSAAVEVVALDGDVGRMNTVFKFYLQVWVMWGVASAVALVGLRDRVITLLRPAPGRWWAITLAVLVGCCALYPLISTPGKVAERFDRSIPPTLDGTAYMASAVYREDHPEAVRKMDLIFSRDQRAIEWIWDNVVGSPVIAEANVPLYRWGSRISIYTGLPTIIGWDHHQKQQRGGYVPGMPPVVDDRVRDVRALYSDVNRERTLQLLNKYDVTYVYVGDLERAFYPEEGLRKFDQMVGSDLDLVYDQDGVKIYRVRGKP
ncbi:MAG TPA: DUF2298 domain-containing protein [Chloroflexota bacterium]|jgi:YYY domain-containing protein